VKHILRANTDHIFVKFVRDGGANNRHISIYWMKW